MKRIAAGIVALWLGGCADDPPGGGADSGGTGLDAGNGGVGDGGGQADGAGADGGGGDANPLETPLSDFCEGEGAVVIVGGGDECAGDIAEETFQFGLCACEAIAVQSNLRLDAFDSRLGLYGEPNISDDGNLGINAALQMNGMLNVRGGVWVGSGGFSVGASSNISRNVYAAGPASQNNASTSIERNAYFGGDVTGRYQIGGNLYVPTGANVSDATARAVGGQVIRNAVPNFAPCPCSPQEILDIAALTRWGATHNDNAVTSLSPDTWADGQGPDQIELPCGRYYLSAINHPRGLTVRALGRTVLYVDGDFIIGGGLSLEVAAEAEIDLFIAGSLSVQAAARFGDRAAPSRVRTYVGGNETIVLSASAEFGGNLYAPRAQVVMGASAELFGSLFCRTVEFSGSAAVHYDTAIRTASRDCTEPDGGVPDGGADAGASPDAGGADAGPSPDAGDPGCTRCGGECGDQACLVPPGQTEGTCGPCASDLDCCAPYFCVNGSCQFSL